MAVFAYFKGLDDFWFTYRSSFTLLGNEKNIISEESNFV